MKKNTNRLRMNIPNNIPRFLAYCAIAKACRKQYELRAGLPVVIGLVVPFPDDLEIYAAAAEYVGDEKADLGFGNNGRGDTEVLSLTPALRKTAEGRAMQKILTRVPRVVIVASSHDSFPDEVKFIADDIVQISPPDNCHIQAAVYLGLGERIRDEDVSKIASMPLSMVALTMRKGRRINKSITLLERLAAGKKDSAKRENGPALKDLHGLGEAATWGEELAIDLKDWAAGKIKWSDVDRGILLSGPPGTGKTTFAGALARTCNVDIVIASLARWQSMGHLGDLLKSMRATFAEARKHTPSILFIDEIDAVGDRDKVSGENQQYHVEVVSALLEQLDGAEKREGVVVVGACNNPGRLDPALTRAGRLDRHIQIPLPDAKARLGILRWHLRNELQYSEFTDIIDATDGWSGAAIEKLVRDARRSARRLRRPLEVADLAQALPKRIQFPPALLKRNAYHEAGHALVGLELGVGKLVEVKVSESVELNGPKYQNGGFAHFHEISSLERLPSQILDRITVSVAGAAAEHVFLGDYGAGWGGDAGSDLYRATLLASAMEASYGLGENLIYMVDDSEAELLTAARSNFVLQGKIGRVVAEQFERAKDILTRRRVDVEVIVEALLKRRRLSGQDVAQLLATVSTGCEARP